MTEKPSLKRVALTAVVAALLVQSGLATAQSADDAVWVLTLEEALELGREHAPSLAVADEGINLAQTRELEASLARLPEITARSTLAPSGPVRGNAIESTSGTDLAAVEDIFEDFGFQSSNSLRAVIPIYTFGKIGLAQDLAHVGFEVSMMQYRKAELELVFNVTQAYLGLQLSIAFQEAIDEGVARLDDLRVSLEDRIFEGDPGARTELRRLTIQEAGFAGRIADNRMLAQLSRRGLEYYCGIEGPFDVPPINESLDTELTESESFQALARQHRPDLSLLDAAVEARELQVDIQWRELVPNLFFAIGMTFNYNPQADDQPSPFANDPYNSRGIGFFIGLDWKFSFRRIAQIDRAEVEAARTRAQREEAVGGIEIEVEQAYWEAVGHQDRAEAHNDALRAARAWLNQRTMQYDSGLADFEDLEEPLLAYYAAYATYYQALFNRHLSRANLALKVGLEGLAPGQGLVSEETDDGETTE